MLEEDGAKNAIEQLTRDKTARISVTVCLQIVLFFFQVREKILALELLENRSTVSKVGIRGIGASDPAVNPRYSLFIAWAARKPILGGRFNRVTNSNSDV